jgi:hypothetical protein
LVGGASLLLATYNDYFNNWARNSMTRVAYHSHLAAAVDYLDSVDYDGPVMLSSQYPGPYHDPYAAETLASHADTTKSWRWYDARNALVFPGGDRSLAMFPTLTPLDPALVAYFQPYILQTRRIELKSDDLSPWIDVLEWNPQQSRNALPLGISLTVGDLLNYLGSDLWISVGQTSDELIVATFWEPRRSLSADSQELVIFTHLLEAGQVIAQQDRLDVPPSTWQKGDIFVQLHRISIPSVDIDHLQVETGVYWRAENNPRLQVWDGETALGDRILLPRLDQAEAQ